MLSRSAWRASIIEGLGLEIATPDDARATLDLRAEIASHFRAPRDASSREGMLSCMC